LPRWLLKGNKEKDLHVTMAMTMVKPIYPNQKGACMQTVKASEFKAKCLHIMDEINQTGEEIVITKNGKPVSILKPYRTVPTTIFGLHKGKIESKDDLIAPLDIAWDAQ